MKKILIILLGMTFNLSCFSQNGYSLESGETLKLDKNGNVVNSTNLPNQTSKINSVSEVQSINVEKNSIYNNDGTLKIPGYTPTGNIETDKELYKKAKLLLYQNNHEEYKKIFEKQPEYKYSVTVTFEEFNTLPENKKQYILGHPEKYYIEMPSDNHDCK